LEFRYGSLRRFRIPLVNLFFYNGLTGKPGPRPTAAWRQIESPGLRSSSSRRASVRLCPQPCGFTRRPSSATGLGCG
jgi:hypothetical protein